MTKIRKAVVAGVGAAASALVGAIVQKGGAPGVGEVVAALIAGVLAGWAVWRVPNAPAGPPAGQP